jgi:MFS family permease
LSGMRGTAQPGRLVRYTLLAVTVLGTMSNNIVNVPLRSIARDLDASVSSSVLCVSAFVLTLAVAMPLVGWLGDRFGQKQVLLLSLLLMVVAQAGAALVTDLGQLIVLRAVQGLACAAIPPMVMGLLAGFYPGQLTRMMGAWAAANGIGQAVGPPVGGVISDWAGWRFIFVTIAVACAVVVTLMWRFVPTRPTRATALHMPGAILLTVGMGMLLVATTAVSQPGTPYWIVGVVAVSGLVSLAGYAAVSRGRATAMIPVGLILESRFLRSSLSAFAQMFTLGTVLVALPLYFTGPLDLSTSRAGVIFFTLPAVMAVAAPLVGRLAEWSSPRLVLRSGLGVIIGGAALTGVIAANESGRTTTILLVVMMAVLGGGMAMVQTPAAAGATRSPAGQYGAALGLFSMLRFSGSTAAAAWVALVYPHGWFLVLFLGCSVVGLLGLVASFFGPDPVAQTPIVAEDTVVTTA